MGHIRLVRIRRGRLRRLGLFVDDVLGVRNTPVGPAKLAADDVARLFQLLDGAANGVNALLADSGKPPSVESLSVIVEASEAQSALRKILCKRDSTKSSMEQ